ncbi:hypothetical protein [Thalassotalea sp. SU-HH00458]|uniref:hypothetical protein n=1 Tax=Thalassotalea sp. SU-HH00458 TaxID=3127657 RepID=UPI00310BF367
MIHVNMHIFNKSHGVSKRVCAINVERSLASVADMAWATQNANARRPMVYRFDELYGLIDKEGYEVEEYKLPVEMGYTDARLIREKKQKWLDKRDARYKAVETLVSSSILNIYLFGDSIAIQIQEIINAGGPFKTEGAYYNILNRFIAWGCTKNALLPVNLKNVGSNYFWPEEHGPDNIKRGCGKADNSQSVSKSRGVVKQDEAKFLTTIKTLKKQGIKLTPTNFTLGYRKLFEKIVELIETPHGTRKLVSTVDEKDSLSESQLAFHFRKTLSLKDKLKNWHGNIAYEKDIADRQGISRDGVIGPTFRYEIDATVLDIYVRYPYDTTGRFSMGRPVLYFVIDVYTTVVVGMYIGFHGPDWIGASEAMINAFSNKVDFAARYGVELKEDDWPCHHICYEITVDNGVEYSLGHMSGLLKSSVVGIETVNYVAVFRGDCKGIVERKFGVIANEVVNYEAGSVRDFKREDIHPSNESLWDIDSLYAAIILEIKYHNNNADRLELHDFRMASELHGITPLDIWRSNINEEMNGGRPTTPERMPDYVWPFMAEIEVTVRGDGVYFKGVPYHSDYAKQANWYTKAKLEGAFKTTFRRTWASASFIIYQTTGGEYVLFFLKSSTNKPHRFNNLPWEVVEHRLKQEGLLRHNLKLQQRIEKLKKDSDVDDLRELNLKQIEGALVTTTKAPQKGVRERRAEQGDIDKLNAAFKIAEQFSGGIREFLTNESIDEDDYDV